MKKMFGEYKAAAVFLAAVMFLSAVLLSGCGKDTDEPEPGEQYLMFVGQDGMSLMPVAWSPSDPDESAESQAAEALDAMRNPEDRGEYTSAIPEKVTVEVENIQSGKMDLKFNEMYKNLAKKDEVLLRAAVVQSLVQIEGVSRIRFFIGDEPLKEADGTETGYMQADDFVQNIGSAINSYEKTELTLYFADAHKDILKPEKVSVRYNSSTSLQKLIVEQLLKGPRSEEYRSTLSQDVVLLGVSVKDGICYVNFDEGFLSQGYDIAPDLVIYSIVDSLTESEDVHAVQISVNGQSDTSFQNMIDLSRPFERNLDIVEETE